MPKKQLPFKKTVMEHHVYFWLNEESKSAEARTAFEAGLAALFDIAEVAGGSWGTPAKTAERPVTENSWDYALSMKFASQAEHDIYQDHPEHDLFIDRFKAFWAKVQVMDLEEGA